jgi:hypothetical protein
MKSILNSIIRIDGKWTAVDEKGNIIAVIADGEYVCDFCKKYMLCTYGGGSCSVLS